MLLGLWTNFYEDWELQHVVTFDGINRLIIISDAATEISIKTDVYSAWKEWTRLRDNGKFLPAMRVTGGDPVGGGQYSGDIYFLINDWKIVVGHSCLIDGVIYSDDFPSPFVQIEGTQLVTNKVSSLVSVVETSTIVGNFPTPTDIVNAMDLDSVKLAQIKAILDSMTVPTAEQNATAVWNAPISTMTDKTTIGGYVSRVLLSIPKFLGLK